MGISAPVRTHNTSISQAFCAREGRLSHLGCLTEDAGQRTEELQRKGRPEASMQDMEQSYEQTSVDTPDASLFERCPPPVCSTSSEGHALEHQNEGIRS